MKEIKWRRSVYMSSKISIDSFIYIPIMTYIGDINDNSFVLPARPGLYFNFNSKNSRERFVFKITPQNHYKTLKFFNKIIGWFQDTNMKDLFLTDNDNKLVFNYDYKDLNASVVSSFSDNHMMRAMPDIIEYDGQQYEGIKLYIDKLESMVLLTYDEVETIFGIIKEFDFQSELLLAYTSLDFANRYKRVTSINKFSEAQPNSAPKLNQ